MRLMNASHPYRLPQEAWSIAAAAALFASAGLASRYAPPGVPAAVFGVARLLVGGVILAGYLGPRALATALRVLPAAPLAIAAIAMGLFQWSYFAAVDGAGLGAATLISTAVAPVFADCIEAVRRGARLSRARVAMLFLAAGGVGCFSAADGVTAMSVLLAVLSGAAYAAYAAGAAVLEQSRAGGGLASTAIALLCGGLALLPAMDGNAFVILTPSGLAVMAYLGVVATAMAYALFVSGFRGVSAATALAILLLQPAVALFAGAVMLGEPLGPSVLAGAACIALAMAIQVKTSTSTRS